MANVKNKTRPVFSKGCFWDQDYSKLDPQKNKNYIIARVISRGGSHDELELFRYYGFDTIKAEVVKIKYLNDKVFNYISKLLDIPPEKFRCFKNKGIF
jgi:peptide methionine sulfoxide reductase MsrA